MKMEPHRSEGYLLRLTDRVDSDCNFPKVRVGVREQFGSNKSTTPLGWSLEFFFCLEDGII